MSSGEVTFVAVDVDYRDHGVCVAAVGFRDWSDAAPAYELARVVPGAAAPYEPGSFYRRELPYVLEILAAVPARFATVVIDGFVWLGVGERGLGAHLHDQHPARPAVVGVAKRPWRGGAGAGTSVVRGTSAVPLHVTAIGCALDEAARGVASMHGEHRVPTLLKRVDRLSRDTR